MKVVAIVQARMGSTRLPDKAMHKIDGTPMITLVTDRLSRSERVDEIVVATSLDPRDDPLVDYVEAAGYTVHRGPEDDVLDRFWGAGREAGADVVVRITADCPLVDPGLVDEVIELFFDSGTDYVSNVSPPTFPDGLDVEVFTFAALEAASQQELSPSEREHVTPYLRESGQFTCRNHANPVDESVRRWTVDEPEDFMVVERVFRHFSPRRDFAWTEVLELQSEHPEWFQANEHLTRNAGSQMSTGQKLWQRAKRVIPGGTMLLSKRPEMFLPERWPTYFSRAEGCKVWDLDGNEYIDMSLMGVGTNVLGYGHPEVDAAVSEAIASGNMSTLNCPEEVYLAERLVELHPWADMVRLARSGGEANAIAIRIARAASGRDKVAICGYHGWHDWYLATNLGDGDGLSEHLMPGLDPKGVPESLRGSVLPFRYNDLEELEALVDAHDIGVVKMEVSRSHEPSAGFLQGVRELTGSRDIVLIFDECTSGFRQTLGGLHKLYGVKPDMAVFGKTLGNGYAITAVLGRAEVMQAAQDTFISSTFWTERIGPAAALKTLEVMEATRSYEAITETGRRIGERWKALASDHGLNLSVAGLPALTSFSISSSDWLAYRTLITQQMLASGYLASNAIYVSTAHIPDIVDRYFQALEPVFQLIAECEDGRKIETLLTGRVAHQTFERLN